MNDTPLIPIKLLTIRSSNPAPSPYATRNAEHTASFMLPDDEPLKGVPAATEAEAVHNLFCAETGRALVLPYANHFLPLVKEALRLGWCFSELRWSELRLYPLLKARPLPSGAVEAVQEVLSRVQGCADAARQIALLLEDINKDPREGVMRAHPLMWYAEFTATCVVGWCRMVTEHLGIPDAISGDEAGNFTLGFHPNDQTWASNQARLWWEERNARLQHSTMWLDQLKADLPARDVRIAAGMQELKELRAKWEQAGAALH